MLASVWHVKHRGVVLCEILLLIKSHRRLLTVCTRWLRTDMHYPVSATAKLPHFCKSCSTSGGIRPYQQHSAQLPSVKLTTCLLIGLTYSVAQTGAQQINHSCRSQSMEPCNCFSHTGAQHSCLQLASCFWEQLARVRLRPCDTPFASIFS